MHPNPLFRILAHNLFNHFREFLRVFQNILAPYRRFESSRPAAQSATGISARLVPNCVPRHDSCVRMQRDARDSRGRAGLLPKKIDEHGFSRMVFWSARILSFRPLAKPFKHHARRFIFENRAIPRQTPVTVYERVDSPVVNSAGPCSAGEIRRVHAQKTTTPTHRCGPVR